MLRSSSLRIRRFVVRLLEEKSTNEQVPHKGLGLNS